MCVCVLNRKKENEIKSSRIRFEDKRELEKMKEKT